MNEVMKIFSKRLKSLREEKGYTLEQVAKATDSPASLISYYENGQKEPSITKLLKLSLFFDESVSYLIGESDTRKVKKIAK